jgi:hypothetical protein
MQLSLAARWDRPFRLKSSMSTENSVRVSTLLNTKKISAGGYKGSASELLTLLPLLEHLAHTLRDHRSLQQLGPQFDSFLATCEVGRVYMAMKRRQGGAVTTKMNEDMRAALSDRLAKFSIAYGEEWTTPKDHLSFHIGPHAEALQLLVDCWATERKNQEFKELANNGRLARLKGLERSALSRLLSIQRCYMIDHPNLFEDHLGPSFECPELQTSLGATSVRISKSLHMGLVQCGLDDVLLTADKSYALQVGLCLSVDGVVTLLVKRWDFHRAQGNSRFFCARDRMLFTLTNIDPTTSEVF